MPMKQFRKWMPACVLMSLILSLTSCQGLIDAIFGDTDSPSGSQTTTQKTATLTVDTYDMYMLTDMEPVTRDVSTNSDGAITVTSSNEKKATVTYANGTLEVTPVAKTGEDSPITITVEVAETSTYKSASASFKVYIFDINDILTFVSSITLNKETLDLTKGETATLTATIEPSDATDQTLKWSSDNEAVATVDAEGTVTAVASGTANITVTAVDFGKEDVQTSCKVTVTTPVTGITTDHSDITAEKGEKGQIKASVEPKDADDQKIFWKSEDTSIITVDQDGNWEAVGGGKTNLVAVSHYDESIQKKVTVTVTVSPTEVWIRKTMTLEEGMTGELVAIFKPSDTTETEITWSSSNKNVATVDENGKVTAVAAGTAIITAQTVVDGVNATCNVSVQASIKPVTSVTFDNTELTINVGESKTITATVNPDDATDNTLNWTTSDSSVATVDENGKVTAVSTGVATITATAVSGESATCTITVPSVVMTPTNYGDGGDPFNK